MMGTRGAPGIFQLATEDLFASLGAASSEPLSVVVAFYEIYCGKLFDLLNSRQARPTPPKTRRSTVSGGAFFPIAGH